MGHKVVVFDISVIRALWETRVKKHKAWQKKETERLEKSALEKYVFSLLACSFFSEWGLGQLWSCCGEEGPSGISLWHLLIGLWSHPTLAHSECLIPIIASPWCTVPHAFQAPYQARGAQRWHSKLSPMPWTSSKVLPVMYFHPYLLSWMRTKTCSTDTIFYLAAEEIICLCLCKLMIQEEKRVICIWNEADRFGKSPFGITKGHTIDSALHKSKEVGPVGEVAHSGGFASLTF